MKIKLSLIILLMISIQAGAQQIAPAGTIIIPASSFLDRMPKGDVITDAPANTWYFNNTALVLNSLTNLITWVNVPEAGKYYVYVRSWGGRGKGFKVVIADQVTPEKYGDTTLNLKRGSAFDLKRGRTVVKITRINPSPTVDVIVLSKNPNLKEEEYYPLPVQSGHSFTERI